MRGIFVEALGAVVVGVILFIIFSLTLQHSYVDGTSMEPNLHEGQHLIVSKMAYAFGEPKRGDIVVFPPPGIESEHDYIKRVIGLPGDTVQIIEGTVYINDEPLEEPYLTNLGSSSMAKITVPEGEYFVLGDNRTNSRDSRSFGTVPEDTITGKAWLSVWPIADWGTAPNYKLPEHMVGIPGMTCVTLPEFTV